MRGVERIEGKFCEFAEYRDNRVDGLRTLRGRGLEKKTGRKVARSDPAGETEVQGTVLHAAYLDLQLFRDVRDSFARRVG
jgi:hypothetical protein